MVLDATHEPTRSVLVTPQRPAAGEPDWNVAPGKLASIVLERRPKAAGGELDGPEPVRQLRLLSWGLVPSWAAGPKVGYRMINARAESLTQRSFARPAARRRCLVPADGWYEWHTSATVTDRRGRPVKTPFFIHRRDASPLALAGLYEFWRDPEIGDPDDPMAWLTTFTIVTAAAEKDLAGIHDRQPVALDPEQWSRWLDPELTDLDAVKEMVLSRPVGRFAAHPVSSAVNAAANNGPHLVEPAPALEGGEMVDPLTGEVLPG